METCRKLKDRIVGCTDCTTAWIGAGSTAESETLSVKDCWTKSSFPLAGLLEQCLKRCISMSHDMDSDAGRRMIEKGVSGAS